MTQSVQVLVVGARDDGDGKRNIGGELLSRMRERPNFWMPSVVTSKKAVIRKGTKQTERTFIATDPREFEQVLGDVEPELVFLAIPTNDKGDAARDYMKSSLNAGAKVVTAEKGVAAWHFEDIARDLDKIDLGASLGGGNRFLYHPNLQCLRGRKVTVYGIFNATCNFALWNVGEGQSADQTVLSAQQMHIAEPSPLGKKLTFGALLNGEMPDSRMKKGAFYNRLCAVEGNYLKPDELGEVSLNDDDVERLLDPHEKRRLLFTITNQKHHANHKSDVIGLMQAEKDGWHISIGFVPLNNSPIADWISSVKGIDNGVLAYVDGHRFMNSGPGAGMVTVDAMLVGASRLLGRSAF